MTDSDGVYATVRVVAGTAVPLLVLGGALLRVDPALLGGAGLALGTTFGVVYAYARYVGLDADGRPENGRPADGLSAESRPADESAARRGPGDDRE
jgi:hypothetical protein